MTASFLRRCQNPPASYAPVHFECKSLFLNLDWALLTGLQCAELYWTFALLSKLVTHLRQQVVHWNLDKKGWSSGSRAQLLAQNHFIKVLWLVSFYQTESEVQAFRGNLGQSGSLEFMNFLYFHNNCKVGSRSTSWLVHTQEFSDC